ncbi:hypothetical protein AFL01nite_02610 [Aeromicrobium flavum]|uniref:LysM domain-containing protein n=1 Tax=Aeromicrobium flavum TaxID=416568 RepID=A0A512HR48_9ACTN|nr:LysM peptidoglycan-binding domain-containing protein [Aeromicrobium flavum]GEO87934.1 hypothetical protein AFL01nite_02610 [Aeromicrobium flavum]
MTRQRLHGLAAALLIAGFIAGVPAVLLVIGAAPWDLDLDSVPALLTRRDDGTLALILVTLGAWIAWAIVAATLLVEIAATIRGVRVPPIPGLGIPQYGARQLVAIAALAFAATPATVMTLPAPPVHATPSMPPDAQAVVPVSTPQETPSKANPDRPTSNKSAEPTADYVVKRGDSLWRIAERLLGDGTRYPEIATLNTDVLGARPDFITPGTVLRVPDVQPPGAQTADGYAVRDGDTLWDIASRELGDPQRYREIFELSRDTVQPDGDQMSDPDVIRAGWILTLPEQTPAAAAPAAKDENSAPSSAPAEGPRPALQSIDQYVGHAAAPTIDTAYEEPEAPTGDAETDTEPAHSWLVPGLAAGGVVLAGCVLITIRGHRRTQLRYRRPGQVLAPTPADLRPVEKTAISEGSTIADTLEFVDRALRQLASLLAPEPGRTIPVTHATLNTRALELHLSETLELPEPWTRTATGWTIPATADVGDIDVIPPCPLLVSVGQIDAGDLLLVNLEHFGTIAVTGDPDRAAGLARHITAELALNPWSLVVQTHAVDIAAELGDMVGYRLEHGSADDAEYVTRLVSDVRSTFEAGAGDPDPFRAVITSSTNGLDEIADLITSPGPRLGTALVRVGSIAHGSERLVLTVDAGGRLRITELALEVSAAGLSHEEAKACAAIVEVTRETEPVPIPEYDSEADGWRSHVDQAGALREELTEPRGEGPAGEGSLLPGATNDYVVAAATTDQDIEKLAPVVSEATSHAVIESDPTLDDDLAEWHDPRSRLPKLTLLGPVGLCTKSRKPPPSRSRPQLIEILAYIALHPEGVVSRELSTVFGRSVSRLRTDVGTIRDWLGTNPRTGRPHLPAGDASKVYRETKVAGYQVEDVLIDADLFRRLRARGQARGADGIEDLREALRLVKGRPFSERREKGWHWLFDENHVHETVAAAIIDTAHLVTTHSLRQGNTAHAREAVEVARVACPFDELSRLDQARVAAAEGDEEAAEHILDQGVFNRTDGDLGPVEVPERTKEVCARVPGWDTAKEQSTG